MTIVTILANYYGFPIFQSQIRFREELFISAIIDDPLRRISSFRRRRKQRWWSNRNRHLIITIAEYDFTEYRNACDSTLSKELISLEGTTVWLQKSPRCTTVLVTSKTSVREERVDFIVPSAGLPKNGGIVSEKWNHWWTKNLTKTIAPRRAIKLSLKSDEKILTII